MAILHIFSIENPTNVESFPPSVMDSQWFSDLAAYVYENSFEYIELSDALKQSALTSGDGTFGIFFFENEETYAEFIAKYKITDPVLLSDIETWKMAHNINYGHKKYIVSETDSSTAFV